MIRFSLAAASISALCAAPMAQAENFTRIATFHVESNLPQGADAGKKTVAEIVAATKDGNLLVYTDSPGQRLGMIDIKNARQPLAAGTVALEGEPTSVVVTGEKALVGVVTSKSFSEPSGHVAVVDLRTKQVVGKCELHGQPDSLALSPDGAFLAIAIENERDEKVNDGAIPQMPPGNLTVLSLNKDDMDCASRKVVELTGLAAVAGEDPEPEFVDINSKNEAVVTLQENNHIALVDLKSGKVTAHFSAGTVDLKGVDVKKDGIIDLSGEMKAVPREPDAVRWLDDNRFVTADEGDWKGSSRGFTIFNRDGSVAYASGTRFEMEAVRLGHYPDKRNKKGIEPEGAAAGTFGGKKLFFIGAERASLIGVYEDKGGAPTYLQALPGGVGPEGLLALPQRNLLIAAAETDNRKDGGIGSVVTLYEYGAAKAAYPTLQSADKDGKPIGWGAMSGLAAHPTEAGKLYAVSDSFYAQAKIFTIDATQQPARITDAITVSKDGKPVENLDLEGIAARADGSFWLASEGNPEREKNKTQSQLVLVDGKGEVKEMIDLPASLQAQASRFGFEGVTITGKGDDETVWIAVQREWKDDPKGSVRLLSYKPKTKVWGQVRYPLDAPTSGWVGLSEITAVEGGFVILERDNQIGPKAKTKQLTFVTLDDVKPVAVDAADVPVVKKKLIRDLLADLKAPNGYVIEKVEGFTLDVNDNAYLITDNDGVDGTSGETQFISLGQIAGVKPLK